MKLSKENIECLFPRGTRVLKLLTFLFFFFFMKNTVVINSKNINFMKNDLKNNEEISKLVSKSIANTKLGIEEQEITINLMNNITYFIGSVQGKIKLKQNQLNIKNKNYYSSILNVQLNKTEVKNLTDEKKINNAISLSKLNHFNDFLDYIPNLGRFISESEIDIDLRYLWKCNYTLREDSNSIAVLTDFISKESATQHGFKVEFRIASEKNDPNMIRDYFNEMSKLCNSSQSSALDLKRNIHRLMVKNINLNNEIRKLEKLTQFSAPTLKRRLLSESDSIKSEANKDKKTRKFKMNSEENNQIKKESSSKSKEKNEHENNHTSFLEKITNRKNPDSTDVVPIIPKIITPPPTNEKKPKKLIDLEEKNDHLIHIHPNNTLIIKNPIEVPLSPEGLNDPMSKKQFDNFSTALKDETDKLKMLENRRDMIQKSIDDISSKLNSEYQNKDILKPKLDMDNKKIEKSKNVIDANKNENDQKNNENSAMNEFKQKLQKEHDEKKKSVEDLEKKLAEEKGILDKLKGDREFLRDLISEFNTQTESLGKNIKSNDLIKNNLLKEIEEKKILISKLNNEIIEMTNDIDSNQQEFNNLTKKIKKFKDSIELGEKSKEGVSKNQNDISKKIDTKESDKLKKLNTETLSKLKSMEEELEKAKKSVVNTIDPKLVQIIETGYNIVIDKDNNDFSSFDKKLKEIPKFVWKQN